MAKVTCFNEKQRFCSKNTICRVCPEIEGLPIISEVARSSANVGNGAQTRWANFFHGIFLLLAMLFAVPFIEMIPNAALAAMLLFVGFRLAHPKEFVHMWHIGKEQFVIFTTTIIVTLSSDLLVGVAGGILLELAINIINGAPLKSLFKADIGLTEMNENECHVDVHSALLFSNNGKLKKIISEISPAKTVIINLGDTRLVDHSSLVLLDELATDLKNVGGRLLITGLDEHRQIGHEATSSYKLN